jgi:hypothetical protein
MMGGIMRVCLLEAWVVRAVLVYCSIVFHWGSGQLWDSIVRD